MKVEKIAYRVVYDSVTKEYNKRPLKSYSTEDAVSRLKELFYSDDIEKTLMRSHSTKVDRTLSQRFGSKYVQKDICDEFPVAGVTLSNMINGRPMQIGCFVRACIEFDIDGLDLIEDYYGEFNRCKVCGKPFIVFKGRTHCHTHAHLDYESVEEVELEEDLWDDED